MLTWVMFKLADSGFELMQVMFLISMILDVVIVYLIAGAFK